MILETLLTDEVGNRIQSVPTLWAQLQEGIRNLVHTQDQRACAELFKESVGSGESDAAVADLAKALVASEKKAPKLKVTLK